MLLENLKILIVVSIFLFIGLFSLMIFFMDLRETRDKRPLILGSIFTFLGIIFYLTTLDITKVTK